MIKLFKFLLIAVPCLMIAVLVIVALPKRERCVIDEQGISADYDEPKLTTNSQMSFFYRNDQLSTYRKQRRAEKRSYFRMNEGVSTTDFTKTDLSVLPDPQRSYVGNQNVVVCDSTVSEVVAASDTEYTLKSGSRVSRENAFEVILNSDILGGSPATPHRITRSNTYYAAFTSERDTLYFAFDSANEFVSVKLSGLTGDVEYTLLDSSLSPIKNGWNNRSGELEVQYKGRSESRYYLKLTGSYNGTLEPFSVSLPFDNNEWQWQMQFVDLSSAVTGTFDYYGDEDYFVLPPEVTQNMNKSVLHFISADVSINVVVHDKDGKAIGQYVYIPGQSPDISMYGLENAYAVSLYSYDGDSSGRQYSFVLEHTELTLLDIETFGFKLSPEFSGKTDYYTASVSSIEDKRITAVMCSQPQVQTEIRVVWQCGYETDGKLNEPLPLSPGRNTVYLTVVCGGLRSEIAIVISYKSADLSYGYIKNSAVNMYAKASIGSKVMYRLSKNERVLIIGGDTDDMVNIQLCTDKNAGQTGYVRRSDIFCGYTPTEMPESYAAAINELRAKHPNWKFTFVKTGVDFNSYINSQVGDSSKLNGRQATRDEIQYYVDPRNFLTEQSIFMFEKQTYSEGVYSRDGVLSVWNDEMYASYIMEGAQSVGLSPYFIAARAALESGRGTSKLATGSIAGCEGYYNFYGIGANDSNPSNGGIVAKNNNWNSKRRAIIEGAAWVKTQYIGCQQYSIYFMKFCFVPNRGWHQYMTDIAAPAKDAQNYYKAHRYGGTLNNAIEFVIPVYDNM